MKQTTIKRFVSGVLACVLSLGMTFFVGACDIPSSVGGSSVVGGSQNQNPDPNPNPNPNPNPDPNPTPSETKVDAIEVHFMQLGNKTSGDCTLIKVGDTEVLIDAGSTRGSASTVVPYIKNYCKDGVLEYVVVTHGDQDHIAAFVGDTGKDGVFNNFVCQTIIDFPKTTKTTTIYKDYVTWRNKEVNAGAAHYTALECYYETTQGAQRSYTLGENVTLNILYQKYYEQSTSDENNNSVCVLISQGEDNHYLFTGDLESEGEKSLVESNDLPECTLFKSGHHGSTTSNTAKLVNIIQPKIVVATCVAGDTYGFPKQSFINAIAPYTDKVYVTSYVSGSGYAMLNGNIVVSCDGKNEATVVGSNNSVIFKETAWFKANLKAPVAWMY